MNNVVKIYSLNLMAFLQMRTGQIPKIHYEYDKKLGSKWYGLFEQSEDVENAMKEYKGDEPLEIDLHKFLDALRDITNRKNGIRDSVNVWNGGEGSYESRK